MEEKNEIRVLVVDDEPDIRALLKLLLTGKGYLIDEAGTGSDAVAQAQRNDYDLVILDIMMPEMDGVAACRSLREFTLAPILFLTAKTQLTDKVEAYGSGGDDYLAKPFVPSELLAKAEALIRRYRIYRGKQQGETLGEVSLDETCHCARKGGRQVDLTDKEYDILRFFFQHRGQIIEVRAVYEGVWGERFMPTSTNTVMVHILNLRKKLEDDPTNPKLIRTIWGRGYQFG